MKIKILGSEYEYTLASRNKDPILRESDGYCNPFAKRIVVVDGAGYAREFSDTDNSMRALQNKIKRHEVIHAFFAESGLRKYGEDETLVDWIAWQMPSMIRVLEQIEALEKK